jgi:hypothetical protein
LFVWKKEFFKVPKGKKGKNKGDTERRHPLQDKKVKQK